MLLYLLIIVSLAIGLLALYQSNDARKDNVRMSKYFCDHLSADLKAHKNISKTIDLILKYLKIGGEG